MCGQRRATQCYNVIAPAGFAAAGLAMVNPQQTVPFHATDSFLGQDKGGNPANAGSFLLGGGGVNIIATNPAAVSIRLSNNGNMAIEDVGLLNRQPKVCYLTAGITAASNAALAVQGSHFRLVPDPAGPAQRAINVGGNVLVRVTPQNVTNATAGLGMTAAQSCNTLVQDVIGHAMPQFQFINPLAYAAHPAIPEYNVARALLAAPPAALPLGAGVPLAAAMGGIATAYSAAALAALALGLGAPFTAALQNHGINEYAAPAIGQGFLSTSLIAAAAGAAIPPNPPTFSDHYHLAGGVPMIVHGTRTWNTHWGGVVAVDGADVITLENYARNTEDALAGNDTRYYFQMYTTNPPACGALVAPHLDHHPHAGDRRTCGPDRSGPATRPGRTVRGRHARAALPRRPQLRQPHHPHGRVSRTGSARSPPRWTEKAPTRPGTSGSSRRYQGVDVADRGADPGADAVLTLAEMEHLVATWVVRLAEPAARGACPGLGPWR